MTPNPAGLCMFVCFCVFLCVSVFFCVREREREKETIYITCKGKMLIIDGIERKAIHYSVGKTKIIHFKKKKRKNLSYLCFWQILYQLCLDLELKSHFSFCKPPVLPPKLISRFNCKYYFHSFKKIKDFY